MKNYTRNSCVTAINKLAESSQFLNGAKLENARDQMENEFARQVTTVSH